MKVNLLSKKENIFGDNIAYVEQWDFSKANMSEENRINAVSLVASVCYQNPKALNSDSLYNRLMAESIGLPSSSFEFVPILLEPGDITSIFNYSCGDTIHDYEDLSIIKYGEKIPHSNLDGNSYLLTNLRALITDIGSNADKFYNTKEECEIIAKHFKVFNYKIDLPTRSQMVRHRVNWQELSRRYVSGKRVPFDFYVSEKMKEVESFYNGLGDETIHLETQYLIEMCIEHYHQALKDGIKPQEARRIIPQAAYTQIWGAFQPTQLDNFLNLRLDSHSQWEIQQVAQAMKELCGE